MEGMSPGERRLLAATPLHAITALHGEAGLRERFAIEIASFPGADRQRLERTLDLAARLHAADRRQREPYVNHLLRVATRIISHYQVRDADVISAALLHDAVEDHASDLAALGGQAGTGDGHASADDSQASADDSQASADDSQAGGLGSRAGALAVIAAQFGGRVAELVAAVTNPAYQAGRDKHEQYREHVAASLEASPWARVIKASDFTDNAVGLIHSTGPQLGRLTRKYAPLVPVLRELIGRPDTPLSGEVKAHILGQLDRAQQRFAAIEPGPGPAGAPS